MSAQSVTSDEQAARIPPVSSGPALAEDTTISSLMQEGTTNDSLQSGTDTDPKTGMPFWRLGKRPSATAKDNEQAQGGTSVPRIAPVAPLRPLSPLRSPDRLGTSSPKRGMHPYASATSPALSGLSPRPHSPASSQIFERNVQDEALQGQASPQIPSHIITENHIPPVLEEASAAITDKKLDPDAVEIVTHTMHQPAGLHMTSAAGGEQSMASSVLEEPTLHRDLEESRSTAASMDPMDVRRLSFVSFADVVHGEQVAESGDIPNMAASQRSASPLRSPASSHGLGTSPPTSVSPTFKPLDSSPGAVGQLLASSPPPQTQSPPLDGDLNVETMRQALRKTRSGDLSGAGNAMMSSSTLDE